MRILGNIGLVGLTIVMALALSPTLIGQEQYSFEYTEKGQRIYQHIIDLKLDSAVLELDQAIESEPNNLSYLHLRSYMDFFQVFISEDEATFNKVLKRSSKAIDEIKENLSDSNPYKRFAIAEIQLHTAINRSKFGQMFKSATEILSAYKLLVSNAESHPNFIYNNKSLSVIHSLAETVSMPGIIKKIFGIKGSIELGLQEIEAVVDYSYENSEFHFKEEVDAIYLYILMYQANQPQKALAYLEKARLKPETSLLSAFLLSKIYQRSGLNDKAISILEHRPQGEAYSEFAYLDLMSGICKLRKLDASGLEDIEMYLTQFKGRHYIKEAYQKMGWAALAFNEDIPSYKYYMSQIKTSGSDLVDGDKQALKESNSKKVPDPTLLKARLLSDGGYHHKAYALLVQKAHLFTGVDKRSLEFNYRMGRITHALKNYPEALEYYDLTIENGEELSNYFACNAALQSGLIYESLNKAAQAESYYDMCLSMWPEEYRNSLHQKAKSGKMRVAGE